MTTPERPLKAGDIVTPYRDLPPYLTAGQQYTVTAAEAECSTVHGYRYPDLVTVQDAQGESITAYAYRFKLVA